MSLTPRQILADRARWLRRNMTVYEKRLWRDFLHPYEIPFCAQKVIGNYIVDFYSRRVRLSIEVDGDSHFNDSAREHDRRRTLFLEIQEIKELRFTNTEVKEDFDAVCEVIDQEVRLRRHDLHEILLTDLRSKS